MAVAPPPSPAGFPPESDRWLVIGTAGHIDHGKSTLVEALTGTHPDRLAEEKRRGITLDLGFAHLDLPAAGGRPAARLSFIDVPGHERFVHNMLAGAGGVDAILLTVAADEGVMPQTREHFEICRMLGVRAGVVAITKSDLAGAEQKARARAQIAALTAGSFLQGSQVLEVSARGGAERGERSGQGLVEMAEALRAAAETTAPRDAAAPARLPLDRVFTLRGFGTVVTGTLLSGTIAPDQELELFGGAAGRRLRARGVQVHGAPVAAARAGRRAAVNLAGVEVSELGRGMVLAEPGVFRAADRIEAGLELLPGAPPLGNHARVHLHALSAEVVARVARLEPGELEPGGRAYVELRLAEPLPLIPGDRFILRQLSPRRTIGGGWVVNATAPAQAKARGKPDSAARAEAVRALDSAAPAQRLWLRAERTEWAGAPLRELAWAEGRRLAEFAAAARADPRLVIVADRAFTAARAEAWRGALLAALEAAHAAEPLAAGFSAATLRSRLTPPAPAARADAAAEIALTGAWLERLAAAGEVAREGAGWRRPGRSAAPSAAATAARERLEALFRAAGPRAPTAAEAAAGAGLPQAEANKILQWLLREQVLVKLDQELFIHRDALAELRRRLLERKALGARIGVPEFKQLAGVTRKHAIPLLEFLDRSRATRRVGDEREIL